MRTRWAVGGMAIALFAGVGIGAAGKSDQKAAVEVHTVTIGGPPAADTTTNADPPAPADPPPPPPAAPKVKAKPNARYTTKCEYLLGNFTATQQGFRFVSSASVHNNGNVGIKAVFETTWRQAGGAPVRARKRFKLARGQTKFLTQMRVVTQDNIDQIQAIDAAQQCASKVTLVGTFGQPR